MTHTPFLLWTHSSLYLSALILPLSGCWSDFPAPAHPSFGLSPFFSIYSPLLLSISPEVSHQNLTIPQILFSSQISLLNFKIYIFNCSPGISIWISQIPQRTDAKMNISSSTCHKAHFYLPTLPVSENSTSPSSWKTISPSHRPLSQSFWVASFLIVSLTRGWTLISFTAGSPQPSTVFK